MLRNKITSALVGLCSVFGVIAIAPSAHAVDRTCYDGYFCVYEDRDFSTDNSMYRTNYESGRWDIDMPAVYENDSSWRNRRAQASKTYSASYMVGLELCLVGGGQVNYYYWANDDGASHQLNESC